MTLRSVSLRECLKDLPQTDGEQGINGEGFLMAQQMKFHQQLIGCAAVQRRNHVGERCVEGTLAVSNGPMLTQVLAPINKS